MTTVKRLANFLAVPIADVGDRQRGQVVNILLLGMSLMAIVGIITTAVSQANGEISGAEAIRTTYFPIGVFLLGTIAIYLINHYGSVMLAGGLFVALLTGVIYFSNDPQESISGTNTLLLAIPILLGSLILHPMASLVVALGVSLLFGYTAVNNPEIHLNPIIIITYFAIAFVSWLSSRGLQQAINELRAINRELDRRVDDQTRDLLDALAREYAEANKNQTILASIADGVIVFDPDYKVIVANPASSQLLDLPVNEMLEADIRTLLARQVKREEQQPILDLFQSDEKLQSAIKVRWGKKTLSVSFAPIEAAVASNHVSGAVVVFRDFTKEAEIDRMKNDFVSIAAHELRTPLTAINGYVDVLMMGAAGKLSEKQLELLKIVRRNSDRLNELVGDLLDLSRIESGRISLEITAVSLTPIILSAVYDVQKQFQDRNLSLAMDIPSDLPMIRGDQNRITQVLINLLSNAYKYTPRGGAIVRARQEGNMVQIDVMDTGLGMASEDLERLFTRFFRSESKEVRDQPGTGLGLSITQSLVELQGGKIWVESAVNKGTTFSFTLPIAMHEDGQVMIPSTAASFKFPFATQQKTIMVIDDDLPTAQMLQQHLESAGYHVFVVTRSHEAVYQARVVQPDLITLDLVMNVDGLVILEKLKTNPETAAIPVIIISIVQPTESDLTIGAAAYLQKPVAKERLLQTIAEIMPPATSNQPPATSNQPPPTSD